MMMRSFGEEIGGMVMGIILTFLLIVMLALFFGGIALLAAAVFFTARFIYRKAVEFTSIEHAPQRLFNAPPETRLRATYHYWLYQLWQVTGHEFHTSPNGMMTGSLIVSLGVAGLTALTLALIFPAMAGNMFVICLVLGVGTGVFGGTQLARPAPGLFTRNDEPAHNRELDDADTGLGDSLDDYLLIGEIMKDDL